MSVVSVTNMRYDFGYDSDLKLLFFGGKNTKPKAFLFSHLGWDQIWQCFKDLLSKAEKLFQFSFGSWDIPIVGYLTLLLVTQGNNDHIDIIHYKLDENEFCKSACSSVFSQNVVQ